MAKKAGKYVQIQIYVSDYNERLIGRELQRKRIDMATFLNEIKADALQRAKQGLGGNAHGRIQP
jgi:hypothetical protein